MEISIEIGWEPEKKEYPYRISKEFAGNKSPCLFKPE